MYEKNVNRSGAAGRNAGNSNAGSGRGSLGLRTKISMGIVIGVLMLDCINVPLGQTAAEKLDISIKKDHSVNEIKEALSGAYGEAQAVMSQKMADALEPPYTSSGGVADIKGMTEKAAEEKSSFYEAGNDEKVKEKVTENDTENYLNETDNEAHGADNA